jgi:hypothetical protein
MKITKLTPEQEAQIPGWAKKWVDIGLSTEPADFEAATEAALKAYALCNLKRPMVVLRMGSPYGATVGGALAWQMLRSLRPDQVWDQVRDQVGAQVRDQVWDQVRAQVRDQVGDQVGDQVRAQVWDQVGAQVRDQVRAQVWAQVRNQVWDQVRAQVRDQVRDQVWDQVRDQVRDQVWAQVRAQVGDQVWAQVRDQVGQAAKAGINNDGASNIGWAGYAAWCSYFRDVCGWRGDTLSKFEIFESLVKSCGWTWWHENVLAISDRPKTIKRDNEGRLHCENGPSIAYRDGWSLHHWHGVSIPPEWVTGKKPSAKEALHWANVEQRRAACEILGWQHILAELDAKVIDKDADAQIGTLLEVNLPDSGPERFLSVRCGTGRQFALPVPREVDTALAANAWTYGLDKLSFKPEIRT